MKVGILQFFSWPQRRVPLPTVYARALQRIAIMDKTGYDAVWLAEHHFTHYSVCPSVHLMGMHVANQTQHLRIGMGISLAAFYHPLRLAEEVALLDILSGGRVGTGGLAGDSTRRSSRRLVCRCKKVMRASERPSRSCWQPGRTSDSPGTEITGISRMSRSCQNHFSSPIRTPGLQPVRQIRSAGPPPRAIRSCWTTRTTRIWVRSAKSTSRNWRHTATPAQNA